jgi:hypothetical protein
VRLPQRQSYGAHIAFRTRREGFQDHHKAKTLSFDGPGRSAIYPSGAAVRLVDGHFFPQLYRVNANDAAQLSAGLGSKKNSTPGVIAL